MNRVTLIEGKNDISFVFNDNLEMFTFIGKCLSRHEPLKETGEREIRLVIEIEKVEDDF